MFHIYYYFGLILLVSLIALFAYGIDKYKAQRSLWRIPESFLLGVGFCGGALGALIGMRLFRHKTKHWYFWVVNILGLAWQAAVALYWLTR